MPALNFPEDINVDPREKRKVHVKPAGEARFKLNKSSGVALGGGKKAYGKKSKLLELDISNVEGQ